MRSITCALVVATAFACGGKTRPAEPENAVGHEPDEEERRKPNPGAALLAQEQQVWTLEGQLVAEADAAMRAPEAREALGDPKLAARSGTAEARARTYLRSRRSEATRKLGEELVAVLDPATVALLEKVAASAQLTPVDVFLDYLTYDGLFDLAAMRYLYKRHAAGRYEGEARILAASFFHETTEPPSAKRGIEVVSLDPERIELRVFGARVQETVLESELQGRTGVVVWSSNYERLRAVLRGGAVGDTSREELPLVAGTFRVSYVRELEEYLTINTTNPWATLLYLLPADEMADLYAGVAASGGLEAGSALAGRDPATLPVEGVIGSAERGLAARVIDVKVRPTLGSATPRRGQYLVVTVELTSTLADELRAPAEWFTLATASAEYPEVAVARPDLAVTVLPTAPPGASLLGLPYTAIAPGKQVTLTLVYDVPAEVKVAALVLGSDELALKVEVK